MKHEIILLLCAWALWMIYPVTNVNAQSFEQDLRSAVAQLNNDVDRWRGQSLVADVDQLARRVEQAIDTSENQREENDLEQLLEEIKATGELMRALFSEGRHVSLQAIEAAQRYASVSLTTISGDNACMPVERWEIGSRPHILLVIINSDRRHVVRYRAEYSVGSTTSRLEAGIGPYEAGVIESLENRQEAETFRLASLDCMERIEMYAR